MIRIPDPGRFELRLMDGSSNPYLLQAGILAAGIHGMNMKLDPGEPLTCNMYTDYKNYPDLDKLPDDLEEALEKLEENKIIKDAFGETVINSYGPRPTEATKMVNDFKAEHGTLTAEFKEDLQRWYNKDKGQNVIKDLVELIY